MRIHWAFVVLAVIGTILITWYLRTKDMDFLTPDGAEITKSDETPDFDDPSVALQPEIKDQPNINGNIEQPEDPDKISPPEIKEITEEELGDLGSSPGLEAYRDFARSEPPDRLFELSSTLRARGEFQRALLAFERVIDTSAADPKAQTEAAQGIAALLKSLPSWNVDPSNEIALNLHLGTARKPSDALKKALLEAAILIRESSGDQLDIIPTINSSDDPEAPEDSPIALWLSTPGDEPASSAVITLRLSKDESNHLPEISVAVFKAIRSHLAQQGYPPAPDNLEAGQNYLSRHVTRLMWRDFARSLYQQEKSATEIEDDPAESSDTNSD